MRASRSSCGEHGGLHLRHRGRQLRAWRRRSPSTALCWYVFCKGEGNSRQKPNFSRNTRAMREPGGLERRPTTRARRRTHEDHTTLPRRRATPQTALPRRWPAGWAICPIRSKMHDVQAERARRRLPAPASPWRPPGLHVAATEGTLRLGELPPPSSIQVARATRWTKLRGHGCLPNLTPVVAW